jgi:hypothetical protein
MKTHYVKCELVYFNEIKNGSKTFEVRKNDRGYETGDKIVLLCYNMELSCLTGAELSFKIGFVFNAMSYFGWPSDYVVFSLLPL